MNTLQLAQRLARNMIQPDLGTMPAQGALDIADAMNAGLQELWRGMPATYRTQTLSYVLKAPETVNVTAAGTYSNALTGTPFTAAMLGCTVRVNDDPRDNQITGPSTLLDEFLGQSLTGQAQVFHDALLIFDNIERIVGDVRIYRADGTWYPLFRAEPFRRGGMRFAWYAGYPIPYPTGFNQLRPINRPMLYLLDSEGMGPLTSAQFCLRFYPMPDTDYTARFEAEVSPPVITFANISSAPVDMPVKASLANSALVALCEEQLLRSPLFANAKERAPFIQAAADRARETIHNHAGDAAMPNNAYGSPFGF